MCPKSLPCHPFIFPHISLSPSPCFSFVWPSFGAQHQDARPYGCGIACKCSAPSVCPVALCCRAGFYDLLPSFLLPSSSSPLPGCRRHCRSAIFSASPFLLLVLILFPFLSALRYAPFAPLIFFSCTIYNGLHVDLPVLLCRSVDHHH